MIYVLIYVYILYILYSYNYPITHISSLVDCVFLVSALQPCTPETETVDKSIASPIFLSKFSFIKNANVDSDRKSQIFWRCLHFFLLINTNVDSDRKSDGLAEKMTVNEIWPARSIRTGFQFRIFVALSLFT